jgi:hypothetical protein
MSIDDKEVDVNKDVPASSYISPYGSESCQTNRGRREGKSSAGKS